MGRYCWNAECRYCEVSYKRPDDDTEHTGLACRLRGFDGMRLTKLAAGGALQHERGSRARPARGRGTPPADPLAARPSEPRPHLAVGGHQAVARHVQVAGGEVGSSCRCASGCPSRAPAAWRTSPAGCRRRRPGLEAPRSRRSSSATRSISRTRSRCACRAGRRRLRLGRRRAAAAARRDAAAASAAERPARPQLLEGAREDQREQAVRLLEFPLGRLVARAVVALEQVLDAPDLALLLLLEDLRTSAASSWIRCATTGCARGCAGPAGRGPCRRRCAPWARRSWRRRSR